jgi:hypothetical protein
MMNGRVVEDRVSSNSSRSFSTDISPQPREPTPPAFETAAAKAGLSEPDIGAWMIG